MYEHVGIVYTLMTDTLTTCTLFFQAVYVCVCVCMCPFGFIWSSVMSHTVCLVLHLSLPQGRSVQDKHLIWPGPCFSRRPPRLIFRAQLLQKSFVFVDFEYSRDWWMLVFFCLKMTRVSGKININKSNRKTPRCVLKKEKKKSMTYET